MSFASKLLGFTLNNRWKVVEAFSRPVNATGGHFSSGYRVEDLTDGGRNAFLKAIDFSGAFAPEVDLATAMQALSTAFIHERDLCRRCREQRLSRVAHAIDDGEVLADPTNRMSKVPFLVFEMADGDIRRHLDSSALEHAWLVRSLHHVAVGLYQLHSNGVVHQDLKPSNVLVFGAEGSRVADLGRASAASRPAPHDLIPAPGDLTYAPPEMLYSLDYAPNSKPAWEMRVACDLYLLGSMTSFLFCRAGMTRLVLSALNPAHSFTTTPVSYSDVLPYLRAAYNDVLPKVEATFPEWIRKDLTAVLRELCDPDPARRGNSRFPGGQQYSMQRYVSTFDRIARKAELRI